MDTVSIFQEHFGENMEMTAVIQYILTAAQSLGSRDYFNKFLTTIGGLAGVLFCENEQTDTKWMIICFPNKILQCFGKLGEVSKQQQVKE